MVIRSTESRVRADHREDHPLLIGETQLRDRGLPQPGHHGEAVVAFPGENRGGNKKNQGSQAWCEEEEHGGRLQSYRVSEHEVITYLG